LLPKTIPKNIGEIAVISSYRATIAAWLAGFRLAFTVRFAEQSLPLLTGPGVSHAWSQW
jgi:hypothetical protein